MEHCDRKRSDHVGARPARVRIREAVQRGRSHPMDAGELVRLRCDVSTPWFKSHIALNDSHRTFCVCVCVCTCRMRVGGCVRAHASAFLTGIKPGRILLYHPLCHHRKLLPAHRNMKLAEAFVYVPLTAMIFPPSPLNILPASVASLRR